jgi:hypothetical protein
MVGPSFQSFVVVVAAKALRMAPLHKFVEVVAFVSILLVLLLDIPDALQQAVGFHVIDAKDPHSLAMVDNCHDILQDWNLATTTSLHYFHLINS